MRVSVGLQTGSRLEQEFGCRLLQTECLAWYVHWSQLMTQTRCRWRHRRHRRPLFLLSTALSRASDTERPLQTRSWACAWEGRRRRNTARQPGRQPVEHVGTWGCRLAVSATLARLAMPATPSSPNKNPETFFQPPLPKSLFLYF